MGVPNTPQWQRGVRVTEIKDGSSNTLLVGEKHVRIGDFGKVGADASAYSANPLPAAQRARATWSSVAAERLGTKSVGMPAYSSS